MHEVIHYPVFMQESKNIELEAIGLMTAATTTIIVLYHKKLRIMYSWRFSMGAIGISHLIYSRLYLLRDRLYNSRICQKYR